MSRIETERSLFFGSILLTVGELFTSRYFYFKYKNSTNISIIVSDKTNKLRRDIRAYTQCLGIQLFKNAQSLFYKGTLTYQPKGCECCGTKNEQHTVIKNGFRSTRVDMGLILESITCLVLKLH